MFRRDQFLNIGGFDDCFAPGYYEDTDLCVRLRQTGYRIIYDPRVEILHYEFGSAESSDAALRLQERHREIFVEKHRHFLCTCPDRNAASLPNARTVGNAEKRILFLDDHVPYPELGVGYPRACNLVRSLAKAGCFLSVMPLDCSGDSWENVRRVLPPEVEVLLGMDPADLESFISGRAGYYDLIFVSRPNNMRTLLAALEKPNPAAGKVPIVYDAEAVWALREGLRLKLQGPSMPAEECEKSLEEEISLARAASHVIAVSEIEAEVFRSRGCDSVSVVSHGFRVSPTATPYSERRDLLFVGALDDDPSPNTDALIWFVQEILPLVKNGLGMSLRLMVAGRCGAARVRALAGSDIVLLGQTPDLTGIYDSARVFLAPHRYAGGIPTKILESAAHGLPCVGTDLLANQLGWRHGTEMLSAATPDGFAQAVRDLYSNELLWHTIRTNALDSIERNYSEHRFESALEAALEHAWSGMDARPKGKLRGKAGTVEERRRETPVAQRTDRRVVCITGEPGSVAQAYRVDHLVAAMNRAGATSRLMTIKEALANPQIIGNISLLVLWRAAFDDSIAALLRMARAVGANVMFDADDLVIEPQIARVAVIDGIRTQNLSEREVEVYYRRTLQSFEAADWACGSTQELASAMRLRGKPAFVLPNGFTDAGLRRAQLAVRKRRTGASDGLTRIGYATGTRTHQRDFARAAEAIASVLRQRTDCRLVLFRERNGGSPLLDPSEFKCLGKLAAQIEWRDFVPQDDLPEEFARFDINIAPLETGNPFCEAKSELKFVEAALAEVCTVASPTGPFRRAIRHDETGLLAEGQDQWESALMRLVNDSALRRRLSRAAHQDVLGKYGAHQRAERVAAILDQIFSAAAR
jgi:glycosyltransferase involved in cell wall biosynthesis